MPDLSAPKASGAAPAGRRVLVVVGTDHHPFDRLVSWVDDWLRRHPEQAGGFFVQAGATPVKPVCASSPFLDVDQLKTRLDAAEVIVCHGGPASIADAWARGQVPIAVPRLRRLGEHVDDHQLDFCVKVAQLGRIRLAQTPAAFAGLLEEASSDISGFRDDAPVSGVDQAVARFEALVDELVSRPRRKARVRSVRQQRRLTTGQDFLAGLSDPSLEFDGVIGTTRDGTGSPHLAAPAGVAQEERE
jgi:UDP-N-acetylglucosamine transferase subunit ALG13